MRHLFRIAVFFILLTVLQFNFLQKTEACGPSSLQPVFDYSYAPEQPWTDFASGKLGIIKPGYRRVVLFAAYRYLNGSGFSAPEQQALIEVWKAQFNNEEPRENDMTEAIEEWLKARKSVLGDGEKTLDIYTEKKYGERYEFFPNCSKNAFEVAAKTLSDRATSYGSDSKDVKEWLTGQDEVFKNCAGAASPFKTLGPESPEWLRKDRDYQLAAAAFYSMNYTEARERFQNIAADGDSPWREVADYLVARTLVRRASLGEDNPNAKGYDSEAEEYLSQLIGRASTYNNDARRLLNLVKFRLHPEERERELAQKLPYQNDPSELRQDLIDYTWLLDQLESEAQKKEEERKEKSKAPAGNKEALNTAMNAANAIGDGPPVNVAYSNRIDYDYNAATQRYEKIQKGELITFYFDNPSNDAQANSSSGSVTTFNFDANLSEEDIQQRTEATLGRRLTEAERAKISEARREGFNNKISYHTSSGYKANYYGSEESTLAILPSYLGEDELTEWLFTYQIQNDETYFHALDRWRQTRSQMWLMTAMTKTRPDLNGFKELMEAAGEVGDSSPAFFTIAYYQARILIEAGRKPEARKLLARVLDESVDMPVSTRNLFIEQRMKVSETLSEFLAAATRKPFGFSYEEDTARTIDQIIAEQKSWYNPENAEKSQAEYDLDIEKEFAGMRLWQDRVFFDQEVVGIINANFPTSVMVETLGKPELPDYLKRRMILSIWTRAFLLNDEKTTLAIAPKVIEAKPSISPFMAAYVNAKTPAERQTAGLYLILKNGEMTPYLQPGFDEEFGEDTQAPDGYIWQDERWWCEQYDYTYDERGNEIQAPTFQPPFLTRQQSDQARLQKAALKKTEDGLSYLSGRVLKWAQTGVPDKRLPEALYIIFQGNQWIKYSCGNASQETRNKAAEILKTSYPRSKWTVRMFEDLKDEN